MVAAKKAAGKMFPVRAPSVFARVRPPADSGGHAMEQTGRGAVYKRLERVEVGPPGAVILADGHGETRYDFPKNVFDKDATQTEVYAASVAPLIEDFMRIPGGRNCLLFAYGQTGTGKTHTILGPERAWADMNHPDRGILPRLVGDVLAAMSTREAEGKVVATLHVSAIQFYMMGCSDLLNGNAPVIIDKLSGEFEALGTRTLPVESLEDLLPVYDLVFQNRNTAATYMNSSKGGGEQGPHSGSSRSHASIILTLRQVDMEKKLVQHTTFKVMDLAGAERPSSNGEDTSSAMDAIIAYIQGREKSGNQAVIINYELSMLRTEVVNATSLHRKGVPVGPPKQLGTPASEFMSACFAGTAVLSMLVCMSPAPQNGWETWFACTYGEDLNKLRVRSRPVPTQKLEGALNEAKAKRAKAAADLAGTPPTAHPKSKFYKYRVCDDISSGTKLADLTILLRKAGITTKD